MLLPQWIGPHATIRNSIISNGCNILGTVENSILSPGVYVGEGAVVRDSILFPDVKIEKGAQVDKAIMGENSVAGEEAVVGIPVETPEEPNGITIIENNLKIQPGTRVESGTECTL